MTLLWTVMTFLPTPQSFNAAYFRPSCCDQCTEIALNVHKIACDVQKIAHNVQKIADNVQIVAHNGQK